MKIHVNSAAATAYFEGTCARKEEDRIDKSAEDKMQNSVIQLFPCDEEEREQYSEAAERRDKWAGRCLVFSFLGCFLGALMLNHFLVLSGILLVPSTIALIYGLWYELLG